MPRCCALVALSGDAERKSAIKGNKTTHLKKSKTAATLLDDARFLELARRFPRLEFFQQLS
jgi:hypothetical protein